MSGGAASTTCVRLGWRGVSGLVRADVYAEVVQVDATAILFEINIYGRGTEYDARANHWRGRIHGLPCG